MHSRAVHFFLIISPRKKKLNQSAQKSFFFKYAICAGFTREKKMPILAYFIFYPCPRRKILQIINKRHWKSGLFN
jgi:hypothetical protein